MTTIEERAYAEAEAQGLPRLIADPLVYRDLAVLLSAGAAGAPSARAAVPAVSSPVQSADVPGPSGASAAAGGAAA